MNWKAFWNESAQVRDPDFRRQIGRTFRQVAYTEQQLDMLVERLLNLLQPAPGQTLLELACGNGLLTSRIAQHFSRVTAVDFSEPLISTARRHFARDNVEYIVDDAVNFTGDGRRYDRVLVSAALQHFSPSQASRMFDHIATLIAPGARIVLGDVADGDRKWNFYRGLKGRCLYAKGVILNRPIIGHWWRPADLRRVAQQHGWTFSLSYQPIECPNHYFRYDAVMQAPAAEHRQQSVPLR